MIPVTTPFSPSSETHAGFAVSCHSSRPPAGTVVKYSVVAGELSVTESCAGDAANVAPGVLVGAEPSLPHEMANSWKIASTQPVRRESKRELMNRVGEIVLRCGTFIPIMRKKGRARYPVRRGLARRIFPRIQAWTCRCAAC